MNRRIPLSLAVLSVMLFSGSIVFTQEHPKEHPVGLSTAAVTEESLAEVIRHHIDERMKENDGMFLHYDEETGDTLKLALKKVHEDRLSAVGDDTYFACADFASPQGKVYDLDIFMKGESADELVPTEVVVHKEGGVERYRWEEEEGIWGKVPVEKSKVEAKEKEQFPVYPGN
ncbi:MAG: hypothetical protein V3U24_10135 [Candidatus Neomarinimicrobiota bacterium]